MTTRGSTVRSVRGLVHFTPLQRIGRKAADLAGIVHRVATADAKKEATRDGAPPIDLIDGDRLCDLLKRYDLGVRTTTRTVEDVTVDPAFFAEI